MKTIPFDIEKAKAGAKVVTRDGREAKIVMYDGRFPGSTKTLLVVIKERNTLDCAYYHSDDGRHNTYPTNHDLFLEVEAKYIPFTKDTVPLLKVVTDNKTDSRYVIVASSPQTCFVSAKGWVTYADLLKHCTFEDGSPCGTLES